MLATLRASGERSDYELRGAACNLETMDAFLKQMVMMNVIKLGTFNILFLSFFELEHRCFTSHVMEIVDLEITLYHVIYFPHRCLRFS